MTIVGLVIMWQLMKLVKAIRKVVERVESGSEQIAADAAHMRQFVSNGGMFTKVIGIIMSAMASQQQRRRSDDDE